jgi:ribosome biogenesis SPOUT family RNA methylase Rps3
LTKQFDQQGNIIIKIPLWQELPTVTLRKEIGGTEYTVSCSYDGTQALPAKLLNLMKQDIKYGDENN